MEAWLQLSHAVNVHPVPQVLKLVLITEFCRVSANQGIFGLEIYSLNFGAPAMNVGSMGSDHEMRRVGRATRTSGTGLCTGHLSTLLATPAPSRMRCRARKSD